MVYQYTLKTAGTHQKDWSIRK